MSRILLLAVSMLALAVSAFGLTPIYLDPQDGEVNGHSDTGYCTEALIGPAGDIKGYSIELTYRNADLNLVGVYEGDIFTSAGHLSTFFYTVRPGAVLDTIAVDASDLTGSVSGPGHLFTVCFGPPWTYADHTPLVFVMTDVRDSGNGTVPVSPTNGTVTITFPIGNDTSSWGAIKGLYR